MSRNKYNRKQKKKVFQETTSATNNPFVRIDKEGNEIDFRDYGKKVKSGWVIDNTSGNAIQIDQPKEDDTMTTSEKEVLKLLKIEEGFRSVPYLDTTNHMTVGYGWNLHGRKITRIEHEYLFGEDTPYPLSIDETVAYFRQTPITEQQAAYMLERCILVAEGDAKEVYRKEWDTFPDNIKVALMDMMYNLGRIRYLKFKKHIAAIRCGNWEEAARQIENSLAAHQAPSRYKSIANRMRGY